MDIYIHTAPEQGFHGARMGIKAYPTLATALAAGHPEPSIERHVLHGTLSGDTVYAAHRYDRAPDTHDLVGIYADHASAEQAVGNPCHIVSLKLV